MSDSTASSPSLSATERQRAENIDRLAGLVRADAAAAPALIEQLAEPSWSLRRLVVAALVGLGDVAVAPLCDLLRDRRDSEAQIAAAVDVLAASTGAIVEDAVLALATSPDVAVIADAAQILGRRRSTAAVPTLAQLTLHRDDNVAVAAIEALGRIGGRAAVDPLIASAQSGSFFRTFPAIDVLGRSGDPRAVAPLAALLDDSRYAHEAARALGHTGDKAAVAPLTHLLSRPSDTMVRLAAAALAELHERHVERFGVSGAFDEALRAALPSATAHRLIRAVTGASPVEQAALCRVLGELGDDGAVPTLLRLLDAAAPIAGAAAEALKKLGQNAHAELLRALRDGDSARRQLLLPLISPRSDAVAEIVSCLGDPDPTVRGAACDALARIGNPGAVRSLFPLLADANARVVQAAVGAIQSLGSAETEALTLAAARSENPQVRRAALRIIAYFGYRSALDLLIEAIGGSDERLRDGAVAGLPFLEDPTAMATLLGAARHERAGARAAAMRALGQCQAAPSITSCLRAGLDDPDPWVRYYACQSIGKLAWEDAAEPVATLLDDPAGQVRVAATEALSHMRGNAAFAALRKAADASDVDLRRAALIGLGIRRNAAALPLLLSAAGSPEPATRLVAVSAVAAFDAPEVVPALARAAADRDDSVRTAAVGFLAARPTVEATHALIDLLRAAVAGERLLAALSIASEGRIHSILAALETSDDELSPRLTSALARMHRPEALAALVHAVWLPSVPARKAAAATLGAIGTQRAVEELRRVSIEDPDAEVRRICALALSQ